MSGLYHQPLCLAFLLQNTALSVTISIISYLQRYLIITKKKELKVLELTATFVCKRQDLQQILYGIQDHSMSELHLDLGALYIVSFKNCFAMMLWCYDSAHKS